MRFRALHTIEQNAEPSTNGTDKRKISELYNSQVFSLKAMKKYMSGETYNDLLSAIHEGTSIDPQVADAVATAMKTWAMERDTTHYTHWFQPLTGLTAEKHDSFFDLKDGEAIEAFTGNALIQQEPDASSFPSGGIRNTFEARGYTAWDPSSPAFLMKTRAGVTLCIPTIFVSYTGEALDYKAPLLRALHNLDKAAVDVCRYFDPEVKKVIATLGVEQEYFLVDSAMVFARPDLMLTGRTLFGHAPAKGQQLEDHYFGSIPERVNAFMVELEREAIQLGIPLKTRHNEVAPGQFECAPLFEEVNIAVDHNALLMDILDKISRRNHFICLLHEKPFEGVNGSGKHNNWSLSTDTGVNLLSPGSTSIRNLQFLTFLLNVTKAVHDHAPLLRASIAGSGNDHRLGANEAPPAIISMFMGSELTRVLDQLEQEKEHFIEDAGNGEASFKMDIPKIPNIRRDNTDRNRTSPFAFTGNKFEFRAVGSSANVASPMTVLNAIVAHQLKCFKVEVDQLIEGGEAKEMAILQILKKYNAESKSVRFEGNNYSEEWVAEAEKRGLANVKTTPEALDAYLSDKTKEVFIGNRILTEREIKARHEITLDIYTKRTQIESRLTGELALTHIVPAAIRYQNVLIKNQLGLRKIGLEDEAEAVLNTIKKISTNVSLIKENVKKMVNERKKANELEDPREKALAYCHIVKPFMDNIRYHADKLEIMVEDKLWPLPKYRELLFLR